MNLSIEDIVKSISKKIKKLIKENLIISLSFRKFYSWIKDNSFRNITEEETISMISEHLMTEKAFNKIFKDYKFLSNNPISKRINGVLCHLRDGFFESELKELDLFYESISKKIEEAHSSKEKQDVIKGLYENFIEKAFPMVTQKLGVAYTPIEVVDFMLNSTEYILKKEFGTSFTNEDVHVLDPFTGTGTFINRLIDNKELIQKKDLPRKFEKEIIGNEILLLPYYIACINIEEAYHKRMGGEYKTFTGLRLIDTFDSLENTFESIKN